MNVLDYPVTIETDDGYDTPPNTGGVRIREKKYDLFLKRETMFENNKNKLFSVIWDQCTQSMKDEVKCIKGHQSRFSSRETMANESSDEYFWVRKSSYTFCMSLPIYLCHCLFRSIIFCSKQFVHLMGVYLFLGISDLYYTECIYL